MSDTVPIKLSLNCFEDERGLFYRIYGPDAVGQDPLNVSCVNFCKTKLAGTVRGMHGQRDRFAETKLVFCIQGSIHDVLIDARTGVQMRGAIHEFHLTEGEGVVVPKGYLHGYQTLVDNVQVVYVTDSPYAPGSEFGINPTIDEIGAKWPQPVTLVSCKDKLLPSFSEFFYDLR